MITPITPTEQLLSQIADDLSAIRGVVAPRADAPAEDPEAETPVVVTVEEPKPRRRRRIKKD